MAETVNSIPEINFNHVPSFAWIYIPLSSYKLLNPKTGFLLILCTGHEHYTLQLPLLDSYNSHTGYSKNKCTWITQIHISIHYACKWAKNPTFLVQLDERWAWYKWRSQFLPIKWFIWIVFPEFLDKGFHRHGSKWLDCPLTWNIWLTSYWRCATSLIILHII